MRLSRIALVAAVLASLAGCSSGGSDAAANSKRTNQAPVVAPLVPGSTP